MLPARVAGYDPRWLDELCLAGEVAWGRLSPRPDGTPADEPVAPEALALNSNIPRAGVGARPRLPPATPLALVTRPDLTLDAGRRPDRPGGRRTDRRCLGRRPRRPPVRGGQVPIRAGLGRRPTGRREVDEGLWDLVARGIVTADAFSAVRSLLSARRRRPATRPGTGTPARRSDAGGPWSAPGSGEGRWSLLPDPTRRAPGRTERPASEELAEAVAWQLLARWGVVAWELWARESYRIPWRDVVRALRRLEARGEVLGGRFVAGISGEQYASPEAASPAGRRTPRPWSRGGGRGGRGRSAQPHRGHAGRGPDPLDP